MKLSKLYSNSETFKNIAFNLKGLNVVYADVRTELDDHKNSHDLGKTKLSELIDYLLLRDADGKRNFLLKIRDSQGVSIFQHHVFYLEILLNDGRFLTIKRAVNNNTKISLAINLQQSVEFVELDEWDHEDVPINKARNIVGDLLNFDFFNKKNYSFRKALNYSLRTPPDDYKDVYQLNKFANGKHSYWKPFIFDLLGFDGSLLAKKYANDEQRDEIAKFIEQLKAEFSIKIEDRDDLVAQMQLIENNASEIEEKIDKFNFYVQDKELIEKGIEEIEQSISSNNALAYSLNYDIDRLEKSIANNFAFNLNKVEKVFEESELYFPDQLKHDYTALIEFNKKLTAERNKLIRNTIRKKKTELELVNKDLADQNAKKESLLSFIQDTDTFKRFKQFQKDLVKIETQLFTLREKISYIDTIIAKEKESQDLLDEIQETVDKLKLLYQNTQNNKRYSDIRTKFANYYKRIMDEDARISWNINTNDNVDFPTPKVHEKVGDHRVTAKDEGNTYKKLLCVAFDLAVLTSYSDQSYYRFVYHDDVLSQQDPGVKHRLLALIHDLVIKFDLQYILSVIKSDLPIDDSDNFIFFTDQEVVLRLNDGGPEGTLFGFEF
ncbi:Uncharacterized protein YydD, contains DUF2326 domain [Pedobacter suwonensis]|uniref:Uncharacterized protein YydD, contains DUF2326 domain n=1 Tax=Pedobacter suwonensis TaxID=332999 RepID=A0A1I0SPB3_9SPHI|nr:DUF2326 domain-containing protein [Pedobacter suwonensis]SFA41339.1 Uncharacterized protein YydD, contains DUF2326 domain [Pedobacter suwonensis]